METLRLKANRLINEKSPYLQQHAYNPVDWFPWGDQALNLARSAERPILLSIGYSTCHWCHVMESESFANPEIAELMNRHFVCIKLDREERPDLDQIYMNAVTTLTGSGGWPLNVFLTPDLNPFYGGTYFPPVSRHAGMPSWPAVLHQIASAWADPGQREKIRTSGDKITRYLRERLTGPTEKIEPDVKLLNRAFDTFESAFDPRWGGFSRAPKFPSPPTFAFLTAYAVSKNLQDGNADRQAKALDMAVHTLKCMAAGGIFDQLGGGFHRYATDPQWLVPHFEKMLYDNAQLIPIYLQAFELTRHHRFAEVARETAEYVLRDMTHPEGGFYSAEDADSIPPETADAESARKREGAFFLWSNKEITETMGAESAEVFSLCYGVERSGNVEFDPHGEFTGKNILHVVRSVDEIAKALKRPPDEIETALGKARAVLFEKREDRPRPHLDDKILTAWNGLMVTALARCHQVLDDKRYLDAARKAADFVLSRLYDRENRFLYRRWRDGERKVPGTAEDYFFFVQGLVDLYETDFDPRWLNTAIELTDEAVRLFHDTETGGFFMTRDDHDPHLIFRVKEEMDMVLPSAGSVAACSMLRLARWTGRQDLENLASETIQAGLSKFRTHPEAAATLLTALIYRMATPVQVVVAGSPDRSETRDLLTAARTPLVQGKTLMLVRNEADRSTLGSRLPFVNSAVEVDGQPAAYVCIGRNCKAPVTGPDALDGLLAAVRFKSHRGVEIGD